MNDPSGQDDCWLQQVEPISKMLFTGPEGRCAGGSEAGPAGAGKPAADSCA